MREYMYADGFATVSGEHDVRIVLPTAGVELREIIEVGQFSGRMTLVQSGGIDNCRTWVLAYNQGS